MVKNGKSDKRQSTVAGGGILKGLKLMLVRGDAISLSNRSSLSYL